MDRSTAKSRRRRRAVVTQLVGERGDGKGDEEPDQDQWHAADSLEVLELRRQFGRVGKSLRAELTLQVGNRRVGIDAVCPSHLAELLDAERPFHIGGIADLGHEPGRDPGTLGEARVDLVREQGDPDDSQPVGASTLDGDRGTDVHPELLGGRWPEGHLVLCPRGRALGGNELDAAFDWLDVEERDADVIDR